MAGQNGVEPVLLHIAKVEDAFWGNADYANKGFKLVSGANAFRDFNWMTNTPQMNAAGDLRGMVLNADWRVRFNFFSDIGDDIGNAAILASMAANIMELAPKFEATYQSNDNAGFKGLKYTVLAGTVAQRTLASTITGGTHLIYKGLEGTCLLAGKIGGSTTQFPTALCVNLFQDADADVQFASNYVTDPTNQQQAILWIANLFVISKAR